MLGVATRMESKSNKAVADSNHREFCCFIWLFYLVTNVGLALMLPDYIVSYNFYLESFYLDQSVEDKLLVFCQTLKEAF